MTLELYWDEQDPTNPGWAYRYGERDCRQSGPVDSLQELLEVMAAADAVGLLPSDLGRLVSDEDSFHHDLDFGGGYPDYWVSCGWPVVAWDEERLLLADNTIIGR